MRKNSLVKEFMKNNKVLVEYLYDSNGFKKGVVVAIGRDKIGFSMVAKEDYEVYTGSLMNIPAVGRAAEFVETEGMPARFLFDTPAMRSFARGEVVIYPAFDRTIGLSIAIDRALSGFKGKVVFNKGEEEYVELPYDKDVQEVIDKMITRSRAYFKE